MQLLDTSILIQLDESLLAQDRTVLSAISETELRFGIEHAGQSKERTMRIRRLARVEFLVGAGWAPFDSAAAQSYGRLAAIVAKIRPSQSRSKDIMLAGHAHSLGASLVTLNPKVFELISDEVEIIVPEPR